MTALALLVEGMLPCPARATWVVAGMARGRPTMLLMQMLFAAYRALEPLSEPPEHRQSITRASPEHYQSIVKLSSEHLATASSELVVADSGGVVAH